MSFDGVAQATFADYCASVDLLAGRRQTLIGTLEQTVPGCSHAETIGRLRCFRGIETLTAAGLCAEIRPPTPLVAPTPYQWVSSDAPGGMTGPFPS
jgi:hypothetical protein